LFANTGQTFGRGAWHKKVKKNTVTLWFSATVMNA